MARRYNRDNRGRFSGGAGATARGGRLKTASGKKRATVTAKVAGGRPAGTVSKRASSKPAPRVAANKISRTGGLKRPPKGAANAVKPYRPATFDGQFSAIDRRVDRGMKKAVDAGNKARKLKPVADQMRRDLERISARAIQDRFKKGVDGEIAGITLRTLGAGPGRDAIRRKMTRASALAKRGSKAGKRAQEIYANQLAKIPTGKVKAANNIAPGRGSKPKGSGKKKRKRKPKK